MPNHVHLMIETPEPNLGTGIQWLHSRYALAFNQRHDRIGHLFAGRYKSPVVTSDGAFVKLVGYIVMNPVAAKLCTRPDDWPWASHAVRSNGAAPRWLAHARLLEWLEEVTAARCYDELILTCERAA
jgi:hypothetical protein